MLDSLKNSASAAVRNTAIGILAAVLALVGIGFLTAALWMALAQEFGQTNAATMVGSLYITLAAIVFVVARLRGGPARAEFVQQSQGPATTPMQGVVLAFMQGLDAAIIAKRRSDRGGI